MSDHEYLTARQLNGLRDMQFTLESDWAKRNIRRLLADVDALRALLRAVYVRPSEEYLTDAPDDIYRLHERIQVAIGEE